MLLPFFLRRVFATVVPVARDSVDVAGPVTAARVFTMLLAVAGAIGVARLAAWFWVDVCRPLFDSFIVRAVQRQRAEFEHYLRAEVFKPELDAAANRDDLTADAIRLSEACNESLEAIRKTQAEQGRALEALPRVAEAADRLDRTLGNLDKTLGDMREEMGRQGGMLEQMRSQGSGWDGVEERRHATRRHGDTGAG